MTTEEKRDSHRKALREDAEWRKQEAREAYERDVRYAQGIYEHALRCIDRDLATYIESVDAGEMDDRDVGTVG